MEKMMIFLAIAMLVHLDVFLLDDLCYENHH